MLSEDHVAIPGPRPIPEDTLVLHRRLLAARQNQVQAEHRLSRLLEQMQTTRGYRDMGYSTLTQYAEMELDLRPRHSVDLARIGRRLVDLPRIEAAFAKGGVGWTKVRELVRVATPATETAWLDDARRLASRDLERKVASVQRGDDPPADDKIGPARQRFTFSLHATEADVLRRALQAMRMDAQVHEADIDDGTALAMLATRYLYDAGRVGGDDTRGSSDVSGSDVSGSDVSGSDVSGSDVSGSDVSGSDVSGSDVSGSDVSRPANDALGRSNGTEPVVPPERFRVIIQACPSCGQIATGERDIADTVAAMAACDAVVVDGRPGPDEGRVSRNIPPKARRAALARTGYRCAVPWCACTTWIDIHHIRPRSDDGSHQTGNLLPLCTLHHDMVHTGRLLVRKQGSGVVFHHADGRTFGSGSIDLPDVPSALVDEVLGCLGDQPLWPRQVASMLPESTHVGHDLHRRVRLVRHALAVLEGAGLAFEDLDGRWVLTAALAAVP